jgi:hypothetical protein
MDKNDLYNILTNMKWLPKSGEIKLKPISKRWNTKINEFHKTIIEKEKIGPLTFKMLVYSSYFLT